MASESYVLDDIKVYVRSMILGKIHFRKKLVSRRYIFPKRTCFRVDCVPKGMRFWKEHVFGRTCLSKETCFWKRVISRRTCFWKKPISGRNMFLEDSSLTVHLWKFLTYTCDRLIYRVSFSEGLGMWGLFGRLVLTNELSVRLCRKVQCSKSQRP